MKLFLDTNTIEDANVFGELLRNYCFVPDETGGTVGCYSTFKLHSAFKPFTGICAEFFVEQFLKSEYFWGKWYKAENLCKEDYKMQLDMFESFLKNLYTDGNIIVTWHWDGDGLLLIGEDNRMVFNSDCKCNYTWEWVK
jgi:hypothetical protein